MEAVAYQREAAAAYARRWAMGRNPSYYDFTNLGGDCTNFVSQCLFAGSGLMNDTPVTGWYYYGLNRRSAAWTGVDYLFRFLVENRGPGPFGQECGPSELQVGDVIQLGNTRGGFYHCLLVMRPGRNPLIAAHDLDALWRPLSSYDYESIRFLHISGVLKRSET